MYSLFEASADYNSELGVQEDNDNNSSSKSNDPSVKRLSATRQLRLEFHPTHMLPPSPHIIPITAMTAPSHTVSYKVKLSSKVISSAKISGDAFCIIIKAKK
jgi:hypothetical protein